MATNCLNKVSSYLPSFSEETRSYCKGLARAGTVFAAGAFLGWNTFINQNLFSWQNAAVALLGAYTFSGKSISVFPDFQTRVEKLHKEIAEASPAHLQQNLEAYKARCLALGGELVRMPVDKRTYYQTFVLLRMDDFLLADSKSRPALHEELIKLYAFELKMKAVPNAILSASYNRGVEKVLRITGGLCLVVGLALARGLVIGLRGNVDDK
ncbi:MAG TPA: hypothetical protein VLG44_07515, partial [Chlamydiales bacterium]|nr:hypothetical protein [Chlamydiales bacterium]